MLNTIKNIFSGGDDTALVEALQGKAYIVDVREPSEFAGGSAAGAINIPLGDVERQVDKFKGHESIVVFCRSGNRSGQAKSILERHGISAVYNGGSWQQVRDALAKGK